MSANNQSHPSDTLSLADLPDEQLLVLFKQGGERRRKHVLGIFYARHAPAVLQTAHGLGGSRDQALEIFNEVWSRACQKLPDFEWQGTPVLHWLLRTTKYVRLEFHRRYKKEARLVEYLEEAHLASPDYFEEILKEIDPPTPPSPEAQPVADSRLVRALSQLKPLERKIVILVYYKNKNSSQISEILGMTPAAVRQRHKRILAKLRLGLA